MVESINQETFVTTIEILATILYESNETILCGRESDRATEIIIPQKLQCAKKDFTMRQNNYINEDTSITEADRERIIFANIEQKRDDYDSKFCLVYSYLWKYTFLSIH